MTQADLNEASKLQKRQQFEEERKKRIFNAKQRLYGVSIFRFVYTSSSSKQTSHFYYLFPA